MKVMIVKVTDHIFTLHISENQRQRLTRIAERKETSYALLIKSLMEKGFEEIAIIM